MHPLPSPDCPNTEVLSPAETYGNQALLLSRATVRYALEHWREEVLEVDHKLARLAGRLGPLLLHAPSLVQHVGHPQGETSDACLTSPYFVRRRVIAGSLGKTTIGWLELAARRTAG